MIGENGKDQFRNAIVEMRNWHIVAALSPLMTMREELVTNDDLADRGGMDSESQRHLLQLLVNCDKWRRRVTHNPDDEDLGDLIAKALDKKATIKDADNPFAGDNIQMASGGLFELPWDLAGHDPNIPLNSQLELPSDNGKVLLGVVDQAIVAWTRLNSRSRTMFVTRHDSLRIYGIYQQVYAYLKTFGGDEHRVDVAQLRATDEPRGPENAPNRKTETAGSTTS